MNASKIPKQYVPKSLTPADRKKQIKSIKEGKDRPKVDSFKSKRSSWAVKFEKKYGEKITNDAFISKNLYIHWMKIFENGEKLLALTTKLSLMHL